MNDQSYIPTLLARASAPAQPELKPYKRADLEALLPHKFWQAVAEHGEPDVDGDPDLQSIAASHCLYVINYVLRHVDDSARAALEAAAAREGHSASMFLSLARARRAVIVAIDPEPPLPVEQPAPELKAEPADRLAPSMAALKPMPLPRFERSFPELSDEEEQDVLPRNFASGGDPDSADAVRDGGGVPDGLCEAGEPEPDASLVARIAAVQPAESLRLGRTRMRKEAEAKMQRSR